MSYSGACLEAQRQPSLRGLVTIHLHFDSDFPSYNSEPQTPFPQQDSSGNGTSAIQPPSTSTPRINPHLTNTIQRRWRLQDMDVEAVVEAVAAEAATPLSVDEGIEAAEGEIQVVAGPEAVVAEGLAEANTIRLKGSFRIRITACRRWTSARLPLVRYLPTRQLDLTACIASPL